MARMSITFIVCCRKLNFLGEPANLNRYSTVNLKCFWYVDNRDIFNWPWDADHLNEGEVGVVYWLLVAVVMTEHGHGVETHPHCGEKHQQDGDQGDVPGHNMSGDHHVSLSNILGHAGLVRLLKCVPENLLVNCEFTWPKVLYLILKTRTYESRYELNDAYAVFTHLYQHFQLIYTWHAFL